jgi:hypothetical protein
MEKVAIIILANNKLEYTRACINSVIYTTHPDLYDLILINNGSSDGTREYFESIGCLVINNPINLGFGPAANQGMRRALDLGYKYICLLNNDTEIINNCIESMLSKMKSDITIGLIQPAVFNMNNQILDTGADVDGNSSNGVSSTCFNVDIQTAELVDIERLYLNGSCILIRSEVLNSIGLFSPDFYPFYHEETDLCIRAHKSGWKNILYGKAKIRHRVNGTSSEIPGIAEVFWRNWNLILSRHGDYIRSLIELKKK